jgi:hypothetical protein
MKLKWSPNLPFGAQAFDRKSFVRALRIPGGSAIIDLKENDDHPCANRQTNHFYRSASSGFREAPLVETTGLGSCGGRRFGCSFLCSRDCPATAMGA